MQTGRLTDRQKEKGKEIPDLAYPVIYFPWFCLSLKDFCKILKVTEQPNSKTYQGTCDSE